MIKLIAILVLSGQLQVAVEQPSGYAESQFSNSKAGAEQLIGFAERSVGNPPDGVRIVIGWLDESVNHQHISSALSDLGISRGLVNASDIEVAASELKQPTPTARAVAAADEKKFGFLYRRKR